MSLRIVCVDDSPMCLHGIRRRLQESNHKHIRDFSTYREFKLFAETTDCDVVIAEVNVKGVDLLEKWEAIRAHQPQMQLLVYSYNINPTHVARASAVDAWDYVFKKHSMERLIASCDAIATQQRPDDSMLMVARRYMERKHLEAAMLIPPLTPREQDVIVHLSLGLTNREISQSLRISVETVKEHIQNVLRKIQRTDRTAAAMWSIEHGIPPLVLEHNAS
jgi:DNA-binding NarL/FixJ family response regulator